MLFYWRKLLVLFCLPLFSLSFLSICRHCWAGARPSFVTGLGVRAVTSQLAAQTARPSEIIQLLVIVMVFLPDLNDFAF